MTGSGFHAAALLPGALCEQFARAVPECRFHSIETIDAIPERCAVLIATPSSLPRGMERPGRWPGNVAWVHLLSTGTDGYPDWLFDGVIMSRSPAVSAVALAEYCLAAILIWSRHAQFQAINDPVRWQPAKARRLAGSELGIAGMGAVGTALASRALGLGMVVRAIRASDRPMPDGVESVAGMAELFATSDHLVLAMPADARTRHSVDATLFARARAGLHLVNVARGSLIKDDDLIDALNRGQIAYATLDATDPEPLPAGHPFYAHPSIRLTPHSAAYDDRTVPDLIALFAENARRFARGEMPLHIFQARYPASAG